MNESKKNYTPKLSIQQREVLEAARSGITGYELAQRGILGYNTRVKELREMGYPIACIMEEHTDKHGRKTKRGRFILAPQT